MANLRDIRNRISSVTSTKQITRAMKMVAAAKLRKAQNRIIAARPYASKLETVIRKLSGSTEVHNIFLDASASPRNILFIVIGSDRGLCGGFNGNLFRELEQHLHDQYEEHRNKNAIALLCVGRKASDYFSKRGYNVVAKHAGFFDNLNFEATTGIMKEVIHNFKNREYDQVFIVYNEFKSVIAQNRKIERILPVPPVTFEKTDTERPRDSVSFDQYIFEPSAPEILNKLIPLHLDTQLWKAVLESNASEQGARMTAMDNATENADELIRDLRLKYNQARQAAITTEISEIVSGADALEDT